MRIILFGEDAFSAIVLGSLLKEHEILGVFCPKYENNIHKRLEMICTQNQISFYIINDFKAESLITQISDLEPDLIAICHFQKLISDEIIKIPKFGCLNLHPSLLPAYRGMSPQHWPIIKGDQFTGITVHFVDDGIDTGNIVLQKKVEILDTDYVFDLQNRMRTIYADIFAEAVQKVHDKDNHIIQNHLPGSYYGRLKKKDCVISEEMTVKEAYNLIRAVSYPYFGARFKEYIIWKASIENETENSKIHFKEDHNKAYLFLKDGTLIINKFEKI